MSASEWGYRIVYEVVSFGAVALTFGLLVSLVFGWAWLVERAGVAVRAVRARSRERRASALNGASRRGERSEPSGAGSAECSSSGHLSWGSE